jgi:hypothetical protein
MIHTKYRPAWLVAGLLLIVQPSFHADATPIPFWKKSPPVCESCCSDVQPSTCPKVAPYVYRERVTSGGEPRKIDPGPPGGPPSDAIVLFDGKDLSQWLDDKNGPARWEVKDGVATVNHTGYIHTKMPLGDMQLHVEWASPVKIEGDGQGRGNSGIIIQGRYEIQVLDSYTNTTYFNGQAGAVYSQYAPLVNSCRPPGEWQIYDIVYHAPRFADDGALVTPARVTVLQNGVLVQDNVTIQGVTGYPPKYTKHDFKVPLSLQDHGNPVRYRNIWVRELN